MKGTINSIVGPYQSAFIKERVIFGNYIISHVLQEKKKNKLMGDLKLDMAKAYDRMEWDSLEATLEGLFVSYEIHANH